MLAPARASATRSRLPRRADDLAPLEAGHGLRWDCRPRCCSRWSLYAAPATAQEMKKTKAATSPDRSGSQNTANTVDRFVYSGRVLDPDLKPVAGAKLHLAYFGFNGQAPPAVRATSDRDGRFLIEVRKSDFVDSTYETPWTTTQVVARAAGFGLGWADASKDEDPNSDPRKLTIRLVREDTPISGRLVDLEGRPVAGATVRHEEILEPVRAICRRGSPRRQQSTGGSYEIDREYLKRKLWPRTSGLPVAITTDSDGRFSIEGVGRERLIRLNVSGPTIQTKQINVVTRADDRIPGNAGTGQPRLGNRPVLWIDIYARGRPDQAGGRSRPGQG